MAIDEYIEGQPVLYRGRFYEDAALTTLTDPADVKAYLRNPEGTNTEYQYSPGAIEREAAGVFSFVVTADLPGDWHWRWEGTDPTTVFQGMIHVRPRNAGP